MNKRDEFLKTQKILRLCTIDKNEFPHITPVWYSYSGGKIHIGTDTNSQKIKNLLQNLDPISTIVELKLLLPLHKTSNQLL